MKKLVFLFTVFIMAVCDIQAQTYYYKLISKVNLKTGVKSSYYGEMYVTFTRNKSICYESDKDGNAFNQFYVSRKMSPSVTMIMPMASLSCDHVYRYTECSNGMYVYSMYYSYWSAFPAQKVSEGYYYACFSADYNRVNINTGWAVYVGERATPPGQASAPTHMW